MPALVKGLLDRCWLPGFAFKYHKNNPFFDRLFAGRSARMIVTSDAPTLYNFLMYFNAPVLVMKKAVLGFCGLKPVRVTTIGNIKNRSKINLEKILEKMKKLGSASH